MNSTQSFALSALTVLLASNAGAPSGSPAPTAPALALQDELDTLVLADGKEVSCRVLYEGEDKIVYRSKKKDRVALRTDVVEVHSIERSLREFFDQFGKLGPKDVEGMADLAAFCEGRELAGEARHLWIRILLASPEDERAWTKLGGSKGRKGWRLKVRGRFYTLEQLRERVSDWKNAMELRTAHFLVRTDIEPERALDLAIDLERAYIEFYDLLGPHLELYVFDEVPEIHVFSDEKNYPTPPTPRDAWFSYTANTLYVNAHEGASAQEIVANLMYGLLYNAFHRTLGKTGSIAPWARRGLAEAFGAAVRPNPGRVRWDIGEPYLPYFEAHARDADALSLGKILKAGRASFDSGKNAHRFIAQAYTLTYFLAYADDAKYRSGLAEFLRSSFVGQGSATHFEKILGVDQRELEVEWSTYVKSVAGT